MSTKESKLIQIFFDVMLKKYEWIEWLSYVDNQEELQDIITDRIDNWRETTDEDYEELKVEFVKRGARLFNKAIRERTFSDLWFNYSPKEL